MNRLAVARWVLILGWVVLLVSMPLIMDYFPVSVWNPQLTYRPTWVVIYWSLGSSDPLAKLILIPYFFGLAAGTITTLVPAPSSRLIWICRIGALGVCELSSLYGVSYLLIPQNMIGGVGGGFYVCALGSLLIGASAWIRPIVIQDSKYSTINE